jgi:hypothetical protein
MELAILPTQNLKGYAVFLSCAGGGGRCYAGLYMNKLLKKRIYHLASVPHSSKYSFIHKLLYLLSGIVAVFALLSAMTLLTIDIIPTPFPHAPLSAAPLIMIGAAYLAFQGWTRPNFIDLCKALIVCTAFILWGVDQMLPAGWPAMMLGDIVITLYVIELGWNIIDRLKKQTA